MFAGDRDVACIPHELGQIDFAVAEPLDKVTGGIEVLRCRRVPVLPRFVSRDYPEGEGQATYFVSPEIGMPVDISTLEAVHSALTIRQHTAMSTCTSDFMGESLSAARRRVVSWFPHVSRETTDSDGSGDSWKGHHANQPARSTGSSWNISGSMTGVSAYLPGECSRLRELLAVRVVLASETPTHWRSKTASAAASTHHAPGASDAWTVDAHATVVAPRNRYAGRPESP